MRARLNGRSGLRALPIAIAVAALAVFAAGCGDDGGSDGGGEDEGTSISIADANGEPETPQITVGAIPITDLMQLYVADSEGYFEDEGLDVTIENMAGGAAIAAAVESGSIDLGWSNSVSIFQAHLQNLDFRFFSGGLYQGPEHWTQSLMVPPGSDISETADLEGKTVAVNTLGNINTLVVKGLLDEAGADPEAVELVEIPFPDMAGALDGGQVDATLPTEPFVTLAKSQGQEVMDEKPFSALGEEPFVAAWFSSADWLEQNPNTAAAFRRAVAKADEYLEKNPDARQQILPEYTEVSPELAGQISFGVNRTEIDPEAVQAEIDQAADLGVIPDSFDASEILVD